jgi:Short C-terminal domain
MGQQEPIRVVVEKKPSGCWGVFGVILLIGLAVEYWYVSLGILVLLVVVGVIARSQQKKQKELEQDKERHRPGPMDPWLNEVAVALADLGLVERARNTGAQVGGVPIDGDIGLDDERLSMFVTLFGSDERARQAELALRAKPEVRTAESNGHSMVKAQGRVLYTANGRGAVVDEFRFNEVISVVDKISLLPPPPRRSAAPVTSGRQVDGVQSGPGVAQVGAAEPEALDQLRKLGELRAAGVLTEAEFDAKKAELLRRI